MAGTLTPIVKTPAALATSSVMATDLDMDTHEILNLKTPSADSSAARLADTKGITIPVLTSAGATINVALSK